MTAGNLRAAGGYCCTLVQDVREAFLNSARLATISAATSTDQKVGSRPCKQAYEPSTTVLQMQPLQLKGQLYTERRPVQTEMLLLQTKDAAIACRNAAISDRDMSIACRNAASLDRGMSIADKNAASADKGVAMRAAQLALQPKNAAEEASGHARLEVKAQAQAKQQQLQATNHPSLLQAAKSALKHQACGCHLKISKSLGELHSTCCRLNRFLVLHCSADYMSSRHFTLQTIHSSIHSFGFTCHTIC